MRPHPRGLKGLNGSKALFLHKRCAGMRNGDVSVSRLIGQRRRDLVLLGGCRELQRKRTRRPRQKPLGPGPSNVTPGRTLVKWKIQLPAPNCFGDGRVHALLSHEHALVTPQMRDCPLGSVRLATVDDHALGHAAQPGKLALGKLPRGGDRLGGERRVVEHSI